MCILINISHLGSHCWSFYIHQLNIQISILQKKIAEEKLPDCVDITKHISHLLQCVEHYRQLFTMYQISTGELDLCLIRIYHSDIMRKQTSDHSANLESLYQRVIATTSLPGLQKGCVLHEAYTLWCRSLVKLTQINSTSILEAAIKSFQEELLRPEVKLFNILDPMNDVLKIYASSVFALVESTSDKDVNEFCLRQFAEIMELITKHNIDLVVNKTQFHSDLYNAYTYLTKLAPSGLNFSQKAQYHLSKIPIDDAVLE